MPILAERKVNSFERHVILTERRCPRTTVTVGKSPSNSLPGRFPTVAPFAAGHEATDSSVLTISGAPPAARTFQALSPSEIFVLGTDGKLWLEDGPFGKVPPRRRQVDGNVRGFQALSIAEVYVLGTDGAICGLSMHRSA